MVHASYTGVGTAQRSVDIVRDVFRLVPIYWVCDLVSLSCIVQWERLWGGDWR